MAILVCGGVAWADTAANKAAPALPAVERDSLDAALKPGPDGARKLQPPVQSPEARRAQMLDDLFSRLQRASDPAEAQALALSIQHIWLQIRSDTASLLMARAMQSIQSAQYKVALLLLDKITALEPGWVEAWNQRAMARFLSGDQEGAMADIDEAIKLEPRHFGALAGMGAILQQAGLDKQALQIYSKALALYPMQPEMKKTVEKLKIAVEGRDI